MMKVQKSDESIKFSEQLANSNTSFNRRMPAGQARHFWKAGLGFSGHIY